MIDPKELRRFVTQAYSSVRHKSKRRGHPAPTFSKEQLNLWLLSKGLEILWLDYVKSGYAHGLRPSIDRIDDYLGYEFGNMQLVTWRVNHIRGVNSQKHHECSVGPTKPVFIYSKDGELLQKCSSGKDAATYLKCHQESVYKAMAGRLKTLYGCVLTGTELTVKETA